MRGTKFFEAEISSAFANQRIFNKHKARLMAIQSQTRNPFYNNNIRNSRKHS